MSESAQVKEIDDKIHQVEKRLAHLSKFIELKCQADQKSMLEEAEMGYAHAECEKQLIAYGAISLAFDEQKKWQEQTAGKLEDELLSVAAEQEAARTELKKMLLSISLTINPIKPKPTPKDKFKRTPVIEQEIEDEELIKLFEDQKMVENELTKIIAQHFVQANLHELETVGFPQIEPKKETRTLGMMIKQDSLQRRLRVAQSLLSQQCEFQRRLVDIREQTKQRQHSMLSEKKSLKSDLIMSQLSYNQTCQRYKTLQSHHSKMWDRVDEVHNSGDLAVLASMKDQHTWLLNNLDTQIRAERQKCEYLDKKLDKYDVRKPKK